MVLAIVGAHFAQCMRNATISVSGLTRNPYFMILGAALLFDNGFLMLFLHCGLAYLGFYLISAVFSYSL